MSIEQAQAFIEKVKNDEDLQKRLSEAQDNESKLEIAKQEGFKFGPKELNKAKEDQVGRRRVGRCVRETHKAMFVCQSL